MTTLAHRRATVPKLAPDEAMARGHLRTALGDVRWEHDRIRRAARYDVNRTLVLTRLRLEYGLLFHTQSAVDLRLMYLMSIGEVSQAVAVLEGWARNPHRPR